ncbi:hypothetical protein CLOM_g1046, partial [Closterium sp. NIES-68]
LNSVNGGYAVAIAGHIAFLPKSLRVERKVYHSQWRTFSILSMNPKIGNIVVKELWPRHERIRDKLQSSKASFWHRQGASHRRSMNSLRRTQKNK